MGLSCHRYWWKWPIPGKYGIYLHCSCGWWIEQDYHTLSHRWWYPHQFEISMSCLCLLPHNAFLASQQLLDEPSVPHTQLPFHQLRLVPLQIGPSHELQILQTWGVSYGTVKEIQHITKGTLAWHPKYVRICLTIHTTVFSRVRAESVLLLCVFR